VSPYRLLEKIGLGDLIIVTAELAGVGSGNTFGSVRGEASSDNEIVSLAGEIAEDMRRNFGVESAALGPAFDLSASLTTSPEAYRYLMAGDFSLHDRNWIEAYDAISQLVEAGTDLPDAHYLMGEILGGAPCMREMLEDIGQVAPTDATSEGDRLPSRVHLACGARACRAGRPQRSRDPARASLRSDASHGVGWEKPGGGSPAASGS